MSAAVEVIGEAGRAQALLHPTRLQLLEQLGEPASAATVAARIGAPRQRINYHLHELEQRKLIRVVAERRRGSVVERLYQRSGDAYAISTAALGALGSSPESVRDRFSAAYQVALASRTVHELGVLQAGAEAAGQRLATLSIEVELRFADPTSRHAFAEELNAAVAALVAKYHDERAPEGRTFRLFCGAYPKPRGKAAPPHS